jgi:CxxC motif-containing protein
MGCEITVEKQGEQIISITGNTCPRGKLYATNEVTCPKRVVTTTVRAENGKMVAVKTDAPVKKSDMFSVVKAANEFTAKLPVKIGDVLIENVVNGINLVSSSVVDR